MYDPDFRPDHVDTPHGGGGSYLTQVGSAFGSFGVTPTIYIGGDVELFMREHGDLVGSQPLRGIDFRFGVLGGAEYTLAYEGLRTTVDAILASHPDVQFFTLEPSTNPDMPPSFQSPHEGNPVDGYGYSPNYDPDTGGARNLISHPSNGWTIEPNTFINTHFEVDGTTVDLGIGLPGRGENGGIFSLDWFTEIGGLYVVDTITYSDDPTNAYLAPHETSAIGHLGYGSEGGWTYLLRPTALTWADQDPSNTANRMWWQASDFDSDSAISQTLLATISWAKYHGSGQAHIQVVGWKLVTPAVGTTRTPGTIAAGPPVGGVVRGSIKRGRALAEGATILSSYPDEGTPGSIATGEPSSGIVRPRR